MVIYNETFVRHRVQKEISLKRQSQEAINAINLLLKLKYTVIDPTGKYITEPNEISTPNKKKVRK